MEISLQPGEDAVVKTVRGTIVIKWVHGTENLLALTSCDESASAADVEGNAQHPFVQPPLKVVSTIWLREKTEG